MGSIHHSYADCKLAFERLIQVLDAPNRHFGDQMPAKGVLNEYGRFKVWSGSVGANHPPQKRVSLDYRLKDSQFYGDNVLDIISRLADTLQKATQLIRGERLPFEEDIDEIEQLSDPESDDSSPVVLPPGSAPHPVSQQPPTPALSDRAFIKELGIMGANNRELPTQSRKEMPRLYEYIKDLIQNLYSMSMVIRRPIPTDRLSRAAAEVQVHHFEEFDQKYVDDCFPDATSALKARMARAITRRRQLLRYNERHYQKLSGPQTHATTTPLRIGDAKQNQQQDVHYQSRASSIPIEAASHLALSVVEKSVLASTAASKFVPPAEEAKPTFDMQSDEGTISSFNFSQDGDEVIRLPQRPLDDDGNELVEFLCPLCFHLVRIRARKAWARHVFKDLQAYVCTFDNCKDSDQMFETRNDWINHEFQYHRREWACSTPAHVAHRNKSDFISHVRKLHSPEATDDQLRSLSHLCERPLSTGEVSCPLCTENSGRGDGGLIFPQLCESVRRAGENVQHGNNDDNMPRQPDGRFDETLKSEDLNRIITWILSTPDDFGTSGCQEKKVSPVSSQANLSSRQISPYKLDPKRVKHHIAQHLERSALFAFTPSQNAADDQHSYATDNASCVSKSSYLSFDSSLPTPIISSAEGANEPYQSQPPSPSMPRTTSGQTSSQSSQHKLSSSSSRIASGSLYTSLSQSYQHGDFNCRVFIPRSDLDVLMNRQNVKSELRKTQKNRLLVLFQSDKLGLLVSRVIEEGRKLFAIFLLLDLPWGVKKLLDAGFTDNDLPLGMDNRCLVSAKSLAKRFDWPVDWGLPRLDLFIDKQWLFLAPVFSTTGTHQTIDPMCPLPFQSVDEVRSTINSVVFKATVHPSQQEGFENETPRLRIALKEFKYKQDFQQEFNNLLKIRDLKHAKHITQKLDSFRQGNKNYIIFPWADGGDLVDVWENMDVESRSPELALWGLEQMLGLAEALQALHDEMKDQENCRHGDLKPGNILHFKTGDYGILKVADFGISRVHVLGTLQRNEPTTTKATTPAYQAPEGDSSKTRSRKYDIWSLGCIFLEFTMWIARRNTAVKTFDAIRKAKTPGDEAYFYEKVENEPVVLHEVQNAFRDLRSLAQCGEDTAFGHLLDIIENDMIKVQVQERIEAGLLCDRLEKVLVRARKDAVYLFNMDSRIGD